MKPRIHLYDATTIGELPWPDTPIGRFGRGFLTPLVQDGVGRYVSNATFELQVILVDDYVIPIAINEPGGSDEINIQSLSSKYI